MFQNDYVSIVYKLRRYLVSVSMTKKVDDV